MDRDEQKSFFIKFGRNLRRLRKEKKLTIPEFAEVAGMRLHEAYNIEFWGRNLSVVTLVKMAKALEVEPAELLTFNDALLKQTPMREHKRSA